MNMKINLNRIKVWVSLLIIISPILNIYDIGRIPISFGDLALLISAGLYLCICLMHNGRIRNGSFLFSGYYAFFFIVTMIIIIFLQQSFSLVDMLKKWSRIIIFVTLMDFVAKDGFEVEYARKWYNRIAVALSCLVIIQWGAFKFFGIVIDPYLKRFPLNDHGTIEDLLAFFSRARNANAWRMAAVFPEPAQFAQYVCLALGFLLLDDSLMMSVKRKYFGALAITLASALAGSAIGIIITGLLWGLWALRYIKGKVTIGKFLFLAALLFSFCMIIIRVDIISKLLYRLSTITEFTEGSSGALRLLQGVFVFRELPLSLKLIGVGFGNVSFYLQSNQITTPLLKDIGNAYMNGFSTALVSSGIIGMVWYLIIWVRLWRQSTQMYQKVAYLVLMVLFCSSNIFYSCAAMLYFSFICSQFESVCNSRR